jgi:hypothetical protein
VSVAACAYLDLDLVADAEKEVAGILHAPFHVWNHKMHGGRDLLALHLDPHRERHFMLGPMDLEHPVHLKVHGPLRPKMSVEVVGSEDHVRIAAALEDVFVHAAIAGSAAALPAGYIDDHFAGGFACTSALACAKDRFLENH